MRLKYEPASEPLHISVKKVCGKCVWWGKGSNSTAGEGQWLQWPLPYCTGGSTTRADNLLE